MNGLRISLFLIGIAASIYAACGLFESLWDFGIGISILSLTILCHGLLVYIEDRDAQMVSLLHRYRSDVWDRRDIESL